MSKESVPPSVTAGKVLFFFFFLFFIEKEKKKGGGEERVLEHGRFMQRR